MMLSDDEVVSDADFKFLMANAAPAWRGVDWYHWATLVHIYDEFRWRMELPSQKRSPVSPGGGGSGGGGGGGGGGAGTGISPTNATTTTFIIQSGDRHISWRTANLVTPDMLKQRACEALGLSASSVRLEVKCDNHFCEMVDMIILNESGPTHVRLTDNAGAGARNVHGGNESSASANANAGTKRNKRYRLNFQPLDETGAAPKPYTLAPIDEAPAEHAPAAEHAQHMPEEHELGRKRKSYNNVGTKAVTFTDFSINNVWTSGKLLGEKSLVDEGLMKSNVTVMGINGPVVKVAMHCKYGCGFIMRDNRPVHFVQHCKGKGHQAKKLAAEAGNKVQSMLLGGAPGAHLERRLGWLRAMLMSGASVDGWSAAAPWFNSCAKVGHNTPESARAIVNDMPALREAEVSKVRDDYQKTAILGRFGYATDGASTVANVEAGVVKYVFTTKNVNGKPTYCVRQKCAVVHLLARSMTGVQLATSTNHNIVVRLGNPPKKCMRSFGIDRASSNITCAHHLVAGATDGAAAAPVNPWFGWTSCFVNDCMSHSSVKVGDKIIVECKHVTHALAAIKGAVSNSFIAKDLYKKQFGCTFNAGSNKTWHQDQHNIVEIFALKAPQANTFACALKSARTAAGNAVTPAFSLALHNIMMDPLRQRQVKMEAAAVMDYGAIVALCTFTVESDNLAPIRKCYNLVDNMVQRARVPLHEPPMPPGTGTYLPNVQALARKFSAWAEGIVGNAAGTAVPTVEQDAQATHDFVTVPLGTNVAMKFGAVWHEGSVTAHIAPSPDFALHQGRITFNDGDVHDVFWPVLIVLVQNYKCNTAANIAGLVADLTATEAAADAHAAAAKTVAVAHGDKLRNELPAEYTQPVTWLKLAHAPCEAANLKIEQMFGDTGKVAKQVQAYKAARMIDPEQAAKFSPLKMANMIHDARAFPFITDDEVDQLTAQLPQYMKLISTWDTEDMADADVLQFWYDQRNNCALTAWHSFAIDMFCQFVSEASVERVFSVLQNAMDDRQTSSLRDYIEAKVLVKYNGRPGQEG
jgi:hypothetical protein